MFKKAGFIIIIIGILIFLQPSLFERIFAGEQTSGQKINAEDLGSLQRGEKEADTEYAAGYDQSDFGEAFSSPDDGKFPVKEEIKPIGPWADLLQLKFSIKFDEEKDDVIFRPKFTEKIISYENKIIDVEGFIIPYEIAANAMGDLSDDGQKFMFSAFPISSCFFCGEAGAESVMEVTPKEPIPYTTQKITIRGRLELNGTDFLKLPYLIKDVGLVED